jgi:hypothetical protein
MQMKFREILQEAVRAPSGDNCQPWRFEVSGDEVRIYNVPEKDTSLFNFRQLASYVAHGALSENFTIAAASRGYSVDLGFFPDLNEPNLVTVARLRESGTSEHPHYPWLARRCTNRRPYDGSPLAPEVRKALLGAVGTDIPGGNLYLTESGGDKAAIAEVIALNDRLVFEHPDLHAFLFEHVRWTPEEAEKTLDGLDLRTLELSFPDSVMFPLFKSWPLVRFLNHFGVSRVVAGGARKQALSAASIGVITVPGTSPEHFLNAGRILERVWLEATRQGLSFQMMTGIIFLMLRAAAGELQGFSSGQLKLIKEAREQVLTKAGGKGEVAVIFRVGKSAPPTVYSLRQGVELFSAETAE